VDFNHVRQVLETAQAAVLDGILDYVLIVAALGATASLGVAAAVAGYVGLVTRRLTLDLGVGRRIQPLGPTSSPLQSKLPRRRTPNAAPDPCRRRWRFSSAPTTWC
jgi:hypothetical protein